MNESIIYKYVLDENKVYEVQNFLVPVAIHNTPTVLDIQLQRGKISCWVETVCDSVRDFNREYLLSFVIMMTGTPFDKNAGWGGQLAYMKTIQMDGYVLHIYRVQD